ncbi:TPA: hypothetical protein NJ921_004584 [Vibrio parahaemolyticus]|nr:hypothetical protein [Vibrio parahaemolyticus]
MESIFTLDARGHVLLEVMTDYFKLDASRVHDEINSMFIDTVGILKSKKVAYQQLRTCLSPSIDKKEVVIVFDTLQISSAWYGGEVFRKIIPLLSKDSSHSVLCGDYIGENDIQEDLFYALVSNLVSANKSEYRNSGQYFLVYINNLSEKMLEDISNGLSSYQPFSGYVDVSYSSPLKSYCSFILSNSFIKHKKVIISGHEDDRDNNEDINVQGYDFEENGYKCVSLQASYFGMFLSYKIERPVVNGFERDSDFSINSMTPVVMPIDDFEIEIDPRKLQYLQEKKTGLMEKAETLDFTKKELEELIRSKISNNYIYHLTNLKEHNTKKFNIIIEKELSDGGLFKQMVSLEYLPNDKKLRLITMI